MHGSVSKGLGASRRIEYKKVGKNNAELIGLN
jgi:hypothetical protein